MEGIPFFVSIELSYLAEEQHIVEVIISELKFKMKNVIYSELNAYTIHQFSVQNISHAYYFP